MQVNFSTKGWYEKYLNLRDQLLSVHKDRRDLELQYGSNDRDKSLYRIIQPTGLMYGHPINVTNSKTSLIASLADRDRMKIIMAESFLNNALLSRYPYVQNERDFDEVIDDSTIGITEFYRHLYPAFDKKLKGYIIRKNDYQQLAEMVITNRVLFQQPKRFRRNFWTRFFSNSLLFLDVFYFGEWMLSADRLASSERIREEKDNMRLQILEVIAASSYADGSIDKEERKLFDYFLKSAQLPGAKKKEIRDKLLGGMQISDLQTNSIKNWILKRYLLEVSVLTVWSDKQVLDSEKEFLSNFAKVLGFDQAELESCIMAIESFVLDHWKEVHYLQGASFSNLGKQYLERMGFVLETHKEQVERDIYRNRQLVSMIERYLSGNITEQEKQKTQVLLVNILKRIPALNIISLPANYLTLENIIRQMPQDILPRKAAS